MKLVLLIQGNYMTYQDSHNYSGNVGLAGELALPVSAPPLFKKSRS